MKKFVESLDSVTSAMQECILLITGISVCVLIVSSAFMRYVLAKDFYGSEDLILFSAFWLYFIGSSLAAREDSHINADMIGSFVKSERTKAAFAIVKYVISLAVAVLTTYWCYEYLQWSIRMKPMTAVLKLPIIIAQIPLFVSFFLMSVYISAYLIRSIKKFAELGKGAKL